MLWLVDIENIILFACCCLLVYQNVLYLDSSGVIENERFCDSIVYCIPWINCSIQHNRCSNFRGAYVQWINWRSVLHLHERRSNSEQDDFQAKKGNRLQHCRTSQHEKLTNNTIPNSFPYCSVEITMQKKVKKIVNSPWSTTSFEQYAWDREVRSEFRGDALRVRICVLGALGLHTKKIQYIPEGNDG